jgi:putative peptidoglycan lipid II flippase
VSEKAIARTSLALLPAHVIVRAGEGALPLLLAALFGRSHVTDVYYFAFYVFSFAGSLVFSAYQDSSLVPVLAEMRLTNPKGVPRLLGAMLLYTLIVGGALAVVIGACAAGYFAIKYEGADRELALWVVVPLTFYLLALSTKTFLSTVLNSERKFFAQPVALAFGVVANVSLIFALRGKIGVVAIPVGSLAGELVASAVLFYAVRAMGVHVEWTLERPEPLKKATCLIAAEVGGAAVTRINPVIDQLMAGFAGVAGGGTLLKYAFDVATVPTSLLQATLLPVFLSHIADDFAQGDVAKVRRVVRRSVLYVAAIMAASGLLLFAVRGPLLRLVYLHGAMDPAGVDRMASIFPYALAGLPPFAILLVVVRAHIAVKNSPIMVPMGFLNAACNAVFNLVLIKPFGLEGLALSTTCTQTVVAMVLWGTFERKIARLAAPPSASS